MNDRINILFTSSGRRVELIKKFKETLIKENIQGNVISADLRTNAPSAYISDRHYIVPRVTEDHYITELIRICQLEEVSLIIPLIDTELNILAVNKELFERNNINVLVSSKQLNEISSNKLLTYQFFTSNNIPTPIVYDEESMARKAYTFPLMIKPYDGSSSKGVTIVKNENELTFFRSYIPNAMVQEYITGDEFTIDVMLDFIGNIKAIVPRLRIETRAGEVSKGITKKDNEIIKAVEQVIKVLPDPAGCITLQCFKQQNGEIKFIEINPRFGGGIPLSIEAGANFPLWTIKMCQGEWFTEQDNNWKGNLTMLRYDAAVFTENAV